MIWDSPTGLILLRERLTEKSIPSPITKCAKHDLFGRVNRLWIGGDYFRSREAVHKDDQASVFVVCNFHSAHSLPFLEDYSFVAAGTLPPLSPIPSYLRLHDIINWAENELGLFVTRGRFSEGATHELIVQPKP